jgi:membrane protease YdiL (CAAX protease family)
VLHFKLEAATLFVRQVPMPSYTMRAILATAMLPLLVYGISKSFIALLAMSVSPQAFNAAMNSIGGQIDLDIFLGSCVIAPFLEEIFFRVLLFNFLSKRLGVVFGGVIATLLFTLAHARSEFGVFLVVFVVLGGVCQIIYLFTRRLIAAVYIHGVYNTLVLLPKPSLHALMESLGVSAPWQPFFLAGMLVASAVLTIYFICVVRGGAQTQEPKH